MRHTALFRALLATTALVGVAPALAQQLPTGGQTQAGQVAIGAPVNGALRITQSSDKAIVNWQSFSIGQGNRVDIQQPGASSVLLNRVTGDTPSTIAGQLNANGQVFLVNPNGVTITKSGRVEAAGFAASTLDIANGDFLSGRYNFKGAGESAAVSNEGAITIARGGYGALIGGSVSNSGTITVPMGKVGLGSGEQATLDLAGDGFLQVAIPTAKKSGDALVKNAGVIAAEGGLVKLTAAAARDMARQAVNMSGVIEARSVSTRGGEVILGGGDGAVEVAGKITVANPAGKGGKATVTGRAVALKGASIDASGATGGGAVKIGGARQGKGDTQRAETTSVDAQSVIKADATTSGTGGDVVVWSDQLTSFAGLISAQGRAQGGDGGQVEVSGKARLDFVGLVDLRAAQGAFGDLLLDPYNVTISDGADRNTSGFTARGNDSIINATTLTNQLARANVTVATGLLGSLGAQAGDITVAAPLAWTAPTSLTLTAANNIAINASISVGDRGGLTLSAGSGDAPTIARGVTITFVEHANNALGTDGNKLKINGDAYQLIYNMDQLDAIDGELATVVGKANRGASGLFALAQDLAPSTTYSRALVASLSSYAVFDGLGHTITGLKITENSNYNREVGLFGLSFGAIRNLALVDAVVTITSSSNISGATYGIGALLGVAFNGSVIDHVSVSGQVTSLNSAYHAGGLVGTTTPSSADGVRISDSSADVVVNGNAYSGGLIGYVKNTTTARTTISRSYALGNVSGKSAGGLIGVLAAAGADPTDATLVDVFALGDVTGTGAAPKVGGLIGSGNVFTLTNAYAGGKVANGVGAPGQVGGAFGFIASADLTNVYWNADSGVNVPIGSGSYTGTLTERSAAQMKSGNKTLFGGFAFGGSAIWSTRAGVTPWLTALGSPFAATISGSVYADAGGTKATTGSVNLYYGNGKSISGVAVGADGSYSANLLALATRSPG